MTYILARRRINKTRHQWPEGPRKGTNDLHPVEMQDKGNTTSVPRTSQERNQPLTSCRGAGQRKPDISGQNVPGKQPATYMLSRCRTKETRHQCPERPRKATSDLHAVEVPDKGNPTSVPGTSQESNQRLTSCRGA